MKYILAILFFPGFVSVSFSQEKNPKGEIASGKSHAVTLEGIKPLGEFDETNGIGVGLRYEHSDKRFGRHATKPSAKFGFIYGAGIGWHDGKKEKTGLVYTYHYDDYLYGYLYGGANFLPCLNGNISVSAGPAFSSYSGTTRFNLYAGINGKYYPTAKYGFGTGFRFLKERSAAWIAMALVDVVLLF